MVSENRGAVPGASYPFLPPALYSGTSLNAKVTIYCISLRHHLHICLAETAHQARTDVYIIAAAAAAIHHVIDKNDPVHFASGKVKSPFYKYMLTH